MGVHVCRHGETIDVQSLQVLIRRELEEAAKTLGDRVRQKDATCEVRQCAHAACHDPKMLPD